MALNPGAPAVAVPASAGCTNLAWSDRAGYIVL